MASANSAQNQPGGAVGDAPESSHPATALYLLGEVNVQLFVDATEEPRIRLPGDPDHKIWHVNSPRVRAWLADWYLEQSNHVMTPGEIGQTLTVLAGRAWKAVRRAPSEVDLWKQIENEPVAQAVLKFMEPRADQPVDISMSELHKRLNNPTIMESVSAPASKLPKLPASLSATLGRLKPTLAAAGVDVHRYRDNGGGRVTLTRVPPSFLGDASDARDDAASPAASPANALVPLPLGRDDTRDAQQKAVLLSRLKLIAEGKL